MSEILRDVDRRVVRETLDEIRAEPAPRSLAGVGCVMALPGFLLLLVFPLVARKLAVASGPATAVLVVGGVLLVVGLGLWFSAGGFVRGRFIAAAEAALRTLEKGEKEREVLLRAATLLLCNAYATYGPSTAETFDFAEGRRRLGPRLDLVMAVEEVLLAEGVIYPVFTDAGEGERGESAV